MAFDYAVALTGSIATGKSSVASIFRDYGVVIIDADRIAHEVINREYLQISKLFGEEYVNKERVDRKLLGSLIFSNKEAKSKLEALLHPLIYQEILKRSNIEERLKKPYIIDIPLFFESNRYPIEKVIVVYTPKEIQLKRLMERDNSSKKEALLRINSQIDIEIKKEKATYLIDNSQDFNLLQQECDRIRSKILSHFL
ncbi:MAG TPA: dephospho-CoA kinase [Campylobacterales bacterium]|nr:dephospho-CoA kinase [Campylobacterales bacterium]